MQVEILSWEYGRNKKRCVVYQCIADDKSVHGPFVAFREDNEEEIINWCQQQAETLQIVLDTPKEEINKVEELRKHVMAYDEATIKEAFAIDDAKLAEIKNEYQKVP